MVSAILDHPWPLIENLDAASNASDALRQFDRLVKRGLVARVNFVDPSELGLLWTHKGRFTPAAIQALMQIAGQYLRESDDPCTASFDAHVTKLTNQWKGALRDSVLTDPADVRSPQIVYASSEAARWDASEKQIGVRLDPCSGAPMRAVGSRPLVELADYDDHPFTACDADPWQTYRWQRRPSTRRGAQHPCVLPKPRSLEGCPPSELPSRLASLRAEDWRQGGAFSFIPPEAWTPSNGSTGGWRQGKAFRSQRLNGRLGPVDRGTRIWAWDSYERHWDVQKRDGTHVRVSHDGRQLPKD